MAFDSITQFLDRSSVYPPAFSMFAGRLFMAWNDSGAGQVRLATYHPAQGWSAPFVPGTAIVPTLGVGLAAYGDRLYLAWTATGTLWIASADAYGVWSSPIELVDAPPASATPALAAFGQRRGPWLRVASAAERRARSLESTLD